MRRFTNIKDKLLKEVGATKNIVDKIIKGKRINKNAYDFIDTIFDYIKELIKKKILIFIKNTENNNFITTLFILSYTNRKLNSSNYGKNETNINDNKILNNKVISLIKESFLKSIKLDEDVKDEKINIKLYYKIPGFFNLYHKTKEYIKNQKFLTYYKKNERELRFCEYQYVSQFKQKMKKSNLLKKPMRNLLAIH